MSSKILKIFLAIGICLGAGVIGSLFTAPAIPTWYATLNKPFFSPPNWVFGPVWTVLYVLMGISLYLVWGKKKVNLKWFWVQLFLNTIWSVAFFGLKSPALAFVVIILLWFSIFQTIKTFAKVNKTVSFLLWPYFVWVSFATILNLALVILNPVV